MSEKNLTLKPRTQSKQPTYDWLGIFFFSSVTKELYCYVLVMAAQYLAWLHSS